MPCDKLIILLSVLILLLSGMNFFKTAIELPQPTLCTFLKSAVVLGSTGNVGRSIVHQLKEYNLDRIILIGRRINPLFENEQNIIQKVVDMDNLYVETNDILKEFGKIDAGFITIGVGRTATSNEEELRKVDVHFATEFAKALKDQEVSHVSILTSVGADKTKEKDFLRHYAGGGLYRHLKGVVEENIIDLKFDSTSIARPGAILANANTPKLLDFVEPVLKHFPLGKYQSIYTDQLARGTLLLNLERKLQTMLIFLNIKAMIESGIEQLESYNNNDEKTNIVNIYEGDDLKKFSQNKQ